VTDRAPVDTKNLDGYGLVELPWSWPREALGAGSFGPETTFFLGTTRADGHPTWTDRSSSAPSVFASGASLAVIRVYVGALTRRPGAEAIAEDRSTDEFPDRHRS